MMPDEKEKKENVQWLPGFCGDETKICEKKRNETKNYLVICDNSN